MIAARILNKKYSKIVAFLIAKVQNSYYNVVYDKQNTNKAHIFHNEESTHYE